MNNIPKWWAKPQVKVMYPGLSRVALAIFGMLPGSGALEEECNINIGGVSDDLVGPKCGSLGLGMVETMMVIRINKDLVSVDTRHITQLDDKNCWQQKIPKREWLCDEVTSGDFLTGSLDEEDEGEYEND
jgi:hypothetical protein